MFEMPQQSSEAGNKSERRGNKNGTAAETKRWQRKRRTKSSNKKEREAFAMRSRTRARVCACFLASLCAILLRIALKSCDERIRAI